MDSEIKALEEQIQQLKDQLSAARRRAKPEPVRDHTLKRPDGSPVKLSELFGGRSDLLVIHNMGRSCRYCTLWADGLQGFTDHLLNRTSVVLSSPDEPAVLREFAASRGWRIPTVSVAGTTFPRDMGFEHEPGDYMPGVSAFRRREDGAIERTGRSRFGPGDDFCAIWPLLDLLDGGARNWAPKYTYA